MALKEYDDEFVTAFARQADNIDSMSPLGIYITDSFNLKNDIRACKGIK